MKHVTYATALVVVLGCGAPTSREDLVLDDSADGGAGGSASSSGGMAGSNNAGGNTGGGGPSNTGGTPNAAGGVGGNSSGGAAGTSSGGSAGMTMTGGMAGSMATGGAAGATMTGGMGGGMGGSMATGGAAGTTMTGGMGGSATSTDPARFNFEATTQGWVDTHNKGGIALSLATTPVFAGARALAVQITSSGAGMDGAKFIGIRESPPSGTAGAPMKFRVWVPAAAPIQGVQPYVMVWNPATSMMGWNGAYRLHSDVVRNAWYEINLAFPDTASKELFEIGVEFTFQSAWQGTVFIDAVHW